MPSAGGNQGRSLPSLPHSYPHLHSAETIYAPTGGNQNYPSITASDGSIDTALAILSQISTPSSILFDPRYTSLQRPSALPPHRRTFPPSPTAERRPPPQVPSTISIQNLDIEDKISDMDKRHPSSFQQLEKLGEGTYATVCIVKSDSGLQYSPGMGYSPRAERDKIVTLVH